jgi:hypothetical protein
MGQHYKEPSKDLTKEQLYESVKLLVEADHLHLHLPQHKLFTLVSIAVQYFLFLSSKNPGVYIFRFENGHLVDKLTKKAKDHTTRRFLEKIFLPRKLIYNQSTFYLDFFHMSSWTITHDLPKHRLQGALIVRDSSQKPLIEQVDALQEIQENLIPQSEDLKTAPSFYSNLRERCPRTIMISFEKDYPETKKILFPLIKDQEKSTQGVYLSSSFQWDSQDEENH